MNTLTEYWATTALSIRIGGPWSIAQAIYQRAEWTSPTGNEHVMVDIKPSVYYINKEGELKCL